MGPICVLHSIEEYVWKGRGPVGLASWFLSRHTQTHSLSTQAWTNASGEHCGGGARKANADVKSLLSGFSVEHDH